VAKKLPQLQRVLDAPALASVAYGEIASSIYFALGLIALHALGFTPVVLGLAGLLFLLVSLSYAEGTTAIRETGGAATFTRIAFNDFAGFLTGWALFLDYLIVIALSTLFMPHYLGIALGIPTIAHHPGDVIFACFLVAAIAALRLLRRPMVHTFGFVVPVLDLITQLLLVGLGFAFLFSKSALTGGMSLGTQPTWHELAFALPLAMLAYTDSRPSRTTRRRCAARDATCRARSSAPSGSSSSSTSSSRWSASRPSPRRRGRRSSGRTGSVRR